ncbi:hypothetical protein T281_10170 [Rhodomicrobium udaipurense JA643]|uniref:Uncharacterized protein n=1 Tax=Rhodomicrobium udaipurense TaxID=1202716 RepID=A0A8I1KKV1_9HYPH|nr:hypothetical protein [Rhodomicrobium udaipurense]KAI94601.1 hypothetical protein T281_10170 [Rhodomicrobium udaipurense JA643]MBJ7542398.1 hypothetical protein [Rhodomicrobium udaipurense]
MINNENIIPTLAFVTLGIVLVFALVHLSRFMQRRRERQNTSLVQRSETTRDREQSAYDSR